MREVNGMKISFLTPTLGNRPQEIIRLLESFRKQTVKDFEVIIVLQENFSDIKNICSLYKDVNIVLIESQKKGLSINRNVGLSCCKGDIIILSDDDCWYPEDAVEKIIDAFKQYNADILLTQIYDQINGRPYKKYSDKQYTVSNKLSLLSRSSIEIAFKKKVIEKVQFDESFGLGARFVCGEEVDFLMRAYEYNANIFYNPQVTVFHAVKQIAYNKSNIVAKGALYAKNLNMWCGVLVCLRDLIIKKELNFSCFWKGYYDYIKKHN